MRDAFKSPYATMDEYHKAKKAMFEGRDLKDGEKRVFIVPAFDFMNAPDKKDSQYGQHSATLVFAERRGRLAISTEFYTSWSVNRQVTVMDGQNIGFMNTGLYFHHRFKKDTDSPEYAYHQDHCPFTGHRCYGEAGSALYGDKLLEMLVTQGSDAIWAVFDSEFIRFEADRKRVST